MNKNQFKAALFAKEKDKTEAHVLAEAEKKIKLKLSLANVDIKIEQSDIKLVDRLRMSTLYDERIVKEATEINRTGNKRQRNIDKDGIILFDFIRSDYSYSNNLKIKEFRVDDTDETYPCHTCNGSRKNTCYTCTGAGKNTCSSCSGRGEKRCSSCSGKGENYCWSCSGKGSKTEGSGENKRQVSCTSCAGRGSNPCNSCANGYVTCTTCTGDGKVTCHTCLGRGDVPCVPCDAQGYFTRFLYVESTLRELENLIYLNGNPDNDFISKEVSHDIFDHSNTFTDYNFNNVSQLKNEAKSLYERQMFTSNQLPVKAKYAKEECVSLTFSLKSGNSIYSGHMKDSEIFFDDALVNNLFYSHIDKITVNKGFKELLDKRSAIGNLIPKMVSVYKKIDNHNKLEKLINSSKSIEDKMIALRKLGGIKRDLYNEHLADIYFRKNLRQFFMYSAVFAFINIGIYLNPPFQNYDALNYFWETSIALLVFGVIMMFSKRKELEDLDNDNPSKNIKNGHTMTILAYVIYSGYVAFQLF
jgi:hypothetical protein